MFKPVCNYKDDHEKDQDLDPPVKCARLNNACSFKLRLFIDQTVHGICKNVKRHMDKNIEFIWNLIIFLQRKSRAQQEVAIKDFRMLLQKAMM